MECVSPDNGQVPTKPTVMVVDDEVIARIVLADELRERGWSVVEAASADEALRVLQGGIRVDLMVTDIRMPGSIDGVALARRARTDLPGLPVVIVSGERPTDVARAVCDGYFEKPYSIDCLLDLVSDLMG